MKRFFLILAVATFSLTLAAQPAGMPQGFPQGFDFSAFFGPRVDTVKIWPNGAPNAFETPAGTQYTEAIMEIYPARNPNGQCVIVCPGGGYAMLSLTHEGRDIHTWFNARGVTCCLLQYRLPKGHHDVPLSDVQEAIRIMRGRTDLGVTKVGVMGFSAGGHLASTAATHFTNEINRPDFQILVYPVITMDPAFTHMSSRELLLGDNIPQDLQDLYSNEKQVTPNTPPAFILLASDDFLVPVKNSLVYYQALVDNHVSATMHIYPSGSHGFGYSDSNIYNSDWTSELDKWLNTVVSKLK